MAAPLAAPDNALENTEPAVDPNAEPTRVFAHWLTAWPAILMAPACPSCVSIDLAPVRPPEPPFPPLPARFCRRERSP